MTPPSKFRDLDDTFCQVQGPNKDFKSSGTAQAHLASPPPLPASAPFPSPASMLAGAAPRPTAAYAHESSCFVTSSALPLAEHADATGGCATQYDREAGTGTGTSMSTALGTRAGPVQMRRVQAALILISDAWGSLGSTMLLSSSTLAPEVSVPFSYISI